jgi:hypothetical protein
MLGISLILAIQGVGQAQSGLATLSVEKIHAKPTLQSAMQSAGKGSSLGRVIEAFDNQLIDRINASRKFKVVAVSDLSEILKAVNRVGQSTEVKQLNYGLVATLDDFEDATERMEFRNLRKTGLRRKVRLSIVAKIYNLGVDPPELYESANIQVFQKDDRMDASELQTDAEMTDELLVISVREAAQKISDRIVDVIFPAKVVAKTDQQVTINRGDGTGLELGQVWDVFSPGKVIKDPDTGEVLGREEFWAGRVRIVAIQARLSTAEILDGSSAITEGMVLRLPQNKK